MLNHGYAVILILGKQYLPLFILALFLLLPRHAEESGNKPFSGYGSDLEDHTLKGVQRPFLTPEEYAFYRTKEVGINSKLFQQLVRCESNWDTDARGDNQKSVGILQFKKETFDLFAKKYSLLSADISDPYHQIDLATLMIKDGYLFHWENCAKKLGRRY